MKEWRRDINLVGVYFMGGALLRSFLATFHRPTTKTLGSWNDF